jgi:hypothetical protein
LALLVFGTIALAAGVYLVTDRRPAAAPRSAALSISGPGYKKSSLVQVHDGWEVRWVYDCPPSVGQGGFGIVGSFDAIVRSANGDPAFPDKDISNQGSAGRGMVAYPQGGSFYLEIQSECNWEVQIFDSVAGGHASSPTPGR